VEQTPEVLRGITLAYVVVPALLHAGSIFILNRYRLDPGELRAAVQPVS
jgi:Na+/melibiose symporter-like transporter